MLIFHRAGNKFANGNQKSAADNVTNIETLILAIFELIFAMKPLKFLKYLKIS